MTSLPSYSKVLQASFSPGYSCCSSSLSLADCQSLLKQYGSQSSAYFTLQDDVPRFGAPEVGFMAYRTVCFFGLRFNIAFANPVCHPRTRPWLLRSFFEQVPGRHLFVGIDNPVSRDLYALGFQINEFGTEFSLDIADFSLRGRQKKQLRHASNLHRRANVEVREQRWDQIDPERVAAISKRWRGSKAVGSRELALLTRPPVLADEWGVRKFYGYVDGALTGYVFFDPYFHNGRIIGYTANILRQEPGHSVTGLLDYIILQAMQRFREEGIPELSLGIAPLHNVKARQGDRSSIRHTARLLYDHGNRLYAFKALGYHKSRYRARESTWFMATDSSSAVGVAWSILQGTGVLAMGGNAPASCKR